MTPPSISSGSPAPAALVVVLVSLVAGLALTSRPAASSETSAMFPRMEILPRVRRLRPPAGVDLR